MRAFLLGILWLSTSAACTTRSPTSAPDDLNYELRRQFVTECLAQSGYGVAELPNDVAARLNRTCRRMGRVRFPPIETGAGG